VFTASEGMGGALDAKERMKCACRVATAATAQRVAARRRCHDSGGRRSASHDVFQHGLAAVHSGAWRTTMAVTLSTGIDYSYAGNQGKPWLTSAQRSVQTRCWQENRSVCTATIVHDLGNASISSHVRSTT
jgi:hypothetical protein